MTTVGIDVGGTKCHGVVADEKGAVVAELRRPTPHAGELIDLLAEMHRELGGGSALGIGVPGLVTPEGIIKASPNLKGAHDIEVGPRLRSALGIPVHVENDATSAAYAEWRVGAARGTDDALIVTLGTYSLFRGLAEAITRGADTFTNFPASFLFLGQERWLGLPTQAWLFVVVATGIWVLVHRTTFGRSFRAIGFSPDGARYAGLPVPRRLAMVYVLAGTIAALAAIIYTARLGQAKADAGMGYELFAITAVVLGGTSIFGGIGTVHGTLLGVAAIAVLNNGLVHARQPREVAGMLTGALLLLALSGSVLPRLRAAWRSRHPAPSPLPPVSKPT